MYSFCLNPEDSQPSGTCNFSRINSARLHYDRSNLIGTKTVSFFLDQKYPIPESLKKYNANINSNNNLILNYDKKDTQLKEIIDLLNKERISFNEINTYESDLEDVFLDLIKNNN